MTNTARAFFANVDTFVLFVLLPTEKHFATGAIKRADDPKCPKKQHLLSYMVMELLGPSVGHLSLELQSYKDNTRLLVQHGLSMLKVRFCG